MIEKLQLNADLMSEAGKNFSAFVYLTAIDLIKKDGLQVCRVAVAAAVASASVHDILFELLEVKNIIN